MNQNEKFNNILNECLDRMLKGETVERCLRSYPEHAKELEPLLRTASTAKVISTIQPRLEFKAKARYEFQLALRDMANKKSRRQPFFSWHWRWQSGWAIAIISVIVLVLAGGGTVTAAGNSMPDNALYPVKLATEEVQLAVTPSDIGKAELNAEFANRRADEIAYMASKGDAQKVQVIAQRLDSNLRNITHLAGNQSGVGADTNGLTSRPRSVAESKPTATNDQKPGIEITTVPSPVSSAQTTATVPAPMAAPAQSLVPQTSPASSGNPAPSPFTKATEPAPRAAPSFGSASPSATVTPPADNSNARHSSDSQNSNNARSGKNEKLKQIIVNNFNRRQNRLEEALKDASPQVKPTVRQAIAQSQAEYEKALKTLEQDQSAN